MAEIREIMDQLKRDAELWRLKFEQSVRNAKAITAERDELAAANQELQGVLTTQEDQLSAKRIDYLDRLTELVCEKGKLIEANDGLEDTISELRGAIKAYVAEFEKTQRNGRRVAAAAGILKEYER